MSVITVSNVIKGRHEQMASTTLPQGAVGHDATRLPAEPPPSVPGHSPPGNLQLIITDLTYALDPPVILGTEFCRREAGHRLLPAAAPDLEPDVIRCGIATITTVDLPVVVAAQPAAEPAPQRLGTPDEREVRTLETKRLIRATTAKPLSGETTLRDRPGGSVCHAAWEERGHARPTG